jgi:putative peptide zinc metalloprotease protein
MEVSQQASAMTPSTQRPIPLELRPDLIVKPIDFLGVGYWVVKDPAGLKYFRLQQEQYEVLTLLNGERSLEQLRDEMLKIMPTVRLQLSDIQHLITDLHEKGLVYANREGQGAALIKKHREEKKKKFFNTMRSLLYIRLPGWDPVVALDLLYPFFRCMFTWWGVGLWMVTVVTSWILLGIQFEAFRQELPGFQQFFSWPNLMYLWVTLGVAKIIHEFGHGLSCKHFGGECHEMGMMLLVFSPCLYCDVSDSWMLKNKWARIMIGAAGMYIEILLSAFAIFVWWYTEQGLLHNLALNTFFVTTITTVIFNANPLMRFDGYYMMSDFLEIPNLRPKSDKLLRETFGWWCLGIESKPDPFMPETGRVWFITFAICAGVYRWFIVVAITVFLYTVLKPYGLQSIGATLAVVSVTTIVGNMAFNLYKMISAPRIEPMSKPKIAITLSVVGLLLAAVLSIPLPLHIEATFIIQPLNVGDVYTQSAGELIDLRVKPGQKVKGPVLDEEGNEVEPGEVLLVLYSPEKEDERRDLELKIKLQEIEERTQAKKNQSGRMHLAQQRIRAFRDQLAEVNDQIEDLTIRATVDGTIVAAPRTPEPPIETRRRQLTPWNGTPLNKKNIGATFEERTHLLSIAPNASYQAIMLIDQGDINEMIQDGFAERLLDQQENNEIIQLKFDHLASRTYEGEIVEVSHEIMEYVPELLSNKLGGELPTVTDSQGREKLLSSVYQATIELREDTQLLRSGMRGRARFRVDERTAWGWIWRYLKQTFHFRL